MATIVSGWASTPERDAAHHAVMPDAILRPGMRLLFRHDPSRVVGSICTLEYRQEKLWCVARVTDPETERLIASKSLTGFSIGFSEWDWKITGEDPYAQINRAVINEISLVEEPANPHCLITSAVQASDTFDRMSSLVGRQYDLFIAATTKLKTTFETLKGQPQ